MISVKEALKRIDESTTNSLTISIPVKHALGCILASEIKAKIDLPPFRQSAMDGYALNLSELKKLNGKMVVLGENRAGSVEVTRLTPNTAIRIFTGSLVPDGADIVIMQEKVKIDGNEIVIDDLNELKKGMNIRNEGEEIKKGHVALNSGSEINAGAVGLLSSLGIQEIEVYSKPSIALLITGDELVGPEKELEPGELFESNSMTMDSAVRSIGFKIDKIVKVKDDYESTIREIKNLVGKFDVVLTSGGISVGDYDFIGRAFNELNVREVFYKVKQKPGKPLYFGIKDSSYLFGLPGNPGSALTCFYIYVLPLLNKLMGKWRSLPTSYAKLVGEIEIKGDRTQFIKGYFNGEEVRILPGQSSFMMRSFAEANCLIQLEKGQFQAGERVKVHLLP